MTQQEAKQAIASELTMYFNEVAAHLVEISELSGTSTELLINLIRLEIDALQAEREGKK